MLLIMGTFNTKGTGPPLEIPGRNRWGVTLGDTAEVTLCAIRNRASRPSVHTGTRLRHCESDIAI